MYQQVIDQVTAKVMAGDWPAGTALPSIRELASASQVSVITVKRAYLELARDGVIVSQQGKGTWVNGALDLQRMQREELAAHLSEAGRLARALSVPEDELLRMLRKYT